MDTKKFIRNSVVYTLLIVGYVLIYLLNIESYLFDEKNIKPKSKVDFIYQQF
jgi:hypothetical protein